MQGTQYAPRESILCMEHFVALQGRVFAQYEKSVRKTQINSSQYKLRSVKSMKF